MTSEVLIMNEGGIALAADSAATVGGYKVYKADKLFELSRSQPIGIMVYGLSTLDGVPIDLLVSEFRHRIEIEGTCFATITECSETFLRFLETGGGTSVDENPIITTAYINNYTCLSMMRMAERIDRNIRRGWYNWMLHGTDEPTMLDTLDALAKKSASGIGAKETNEIARMISESISRSDFKNEIDKMNLWKNQKLRNRLLKIYANGVISKKGFGETCGVVIAGYGSSEYTPSYREYLVNGLYPNGLCFVKRNEVRIDSTLPSYIATFAQDDVMKSFIYGIDPRLLESITRELSKTIDDVIEGLSDLLPAETDQDVLRETNKKAIESFKQNINGLIQYKFRLPVERSVEFLSKDEMSLLAESLVQSTSLRRHVSNALETVGGPIDVSLISRNEGFVWIKRKLYFDTGLNISYLERRKEQRHQNDR